MNAIRAFLLAGIVSLAIPAHAQKQLAGDERVMLPIQVMVIQNTSAQKNTALGTYNFGRTSAQIDEDFIHCLKADIRRQVKRNWRPVTQNHIPVVVKFTLWNTGLASDIHVLKSSQSTALDRLAIQAITKSSPFRYPPQKPVKVEISFDKRMDSGLAESLGAVQIARFN